MHYIYGNRVNLGKVRADENALWSLGAHDVSVVLGLADEEPVQCHAFGESYMRDGIEDVVFCYMRFPSGLAAHLHLSWLDPHKERRFTVVGLGRMATFDDMAIDQKLTVYDKSVDQPYSSYGEYIARSGDVWSPSVPNQEPCASSARISSSASGTAQPRSDGESGLRVVASWSSCRARSTAPCGRRRSAARPTSRLPINGSSSTRWRAERIGHPPVRGRIRSGERRPARPGHPTEPPYAAPQPAAAGPTEPGSARSAIIAARASDDVAAGEGAFRTCSARSVSENTKSSTRRRRGPGPGRARRRSRA